MGRPIILKSDQQSREKVLYELLDDLGVFVSGSRSSVGVPGSSEDVLSFPREFDGRGGCGCGEGGGQGQTRRRGRKRREDEP